MEPNLTLLIFICGFLVPQAIVLGWKKFLHSTYEAKNGVLNLLFHLFCMSLLLFGFADSPIKVLLIWSFMSVAFVGMVTLLCGVAIGRDMEVVLSNHVIYKSFKMFGHPYVIFPITMTVTFIFFVFPF